ncbi:NmrA family NAD(P)-binding protein [Clostridium sp. AL.422]|uniref:SDR family oxidoreductase n=1 Tax=Clostridium TaxID=1485 RepID=UPI00293DE85C|nr:MULTISPECIES: NmrA family NAD(P)-binding protein [unclassified Clostridium]MDV4152289.1 NmrA family NAD(P)-binding protein [Clostridium sp. AL.422]
MNIILGSTGQIGSMLVQNLLEKGEKVRAVVRDEVKAENLKKIGAEVVTADYFDVDALKKAFNGGKTVFLLTPENPESNNFLIDTKKIIDNYRDAILSSSITKIVGLSSMGAHNKDNTGNLMASYMLENAFLDLDIKQVFVRPAYYFSNWIGYIDLIKEYGILPTFFPINMSLPMISPIDVSKFLSDVIVNEEYKERVYEITGPKAYSPLEIAEIFEKTLNKEVNLQLILPEEWEKTLLESGFTKDSAENLILMTKATIDGKGESGMKNIITLSMDFKEYLENVLQKVLIK